MSTILVADDDPDVRHSVTATLQSRQYRVVVASDGREAYHKAMLERPDLVILDVEMPDQDGFEVLQKIRHRSTVPVIFLSVRNAEVDAVLGLKMGADAYLTKPFSEQVLLANVEAMLRRTTRYRASGSAANVIEAQDLEIDCDACEVRRAGEVIKLTSTEYKLLQYLAERCGKVVARDVLLDHISGCSWDGYTSRAVDVYIGRIRRKLGDDPVHPRYLVTVPGIGYKLQR